MVTIPGINDKVNLTVGNRLKNTPETWGCDDST
jgi:hypothetical protein